MIDRRDLWRGLRVIWRHRPRGGYGYVLNIESTVRGFTDKRVQIEVATRRGPKLVLVSHTTLHEYSHHAIVSKLEEPRI